MDTQRALQWLTEIFAVKTRSVTIDDTRDSLVTLSLTTYATSTRDGALSFAPLSAPSAGGSQNQGTFGAQLQYGRYFAEGPDGSPDWGIRFAVTLLFPE